MKPVFNQGKLHPTIRNTNQLIQQCNENVAERQQALVKKYKLDQLKSYGIDEEQGTLNFKLKDDTQLEFEAAPIGVWNSKENQWVWAWSNSSMGVSLFAKSAALKGLSDIIESEDFTEPVISCDANKSQMISIIATEYIGGLGRFIAPQGDFRLHFIPLKKKG